MRILLDENIPESVRRALRALGHEADSIFSLRLKGLDNGRLYREVAQSYDLLFTKDRELVRSVRAIRVLHSAHSVRVLRVTLPQGPGGLFTRAFMEAFEQTDWAAYPHGADWPAT